LATFFVANGIEGSAVALVFRTRRSLGSLRSLGMTKPIMTNISGTQRYSSLPIGVEEATVLKWFFP
jgi:hypothetical protein